MKNDAPKPTPIEVQKCYTLVDSSDICYKIKLTFSSDKLIIDIIQEDSFPKIYYSSFFILEEIQKNDKWFRLFDTFDESIDTIDGLFEEKQVKITKNENNINLTLIHSEKNISDSIFKIEKKEESEDDIIPKLLESHNDLRKRVKMLEKNNKEMKETLDKIMSIPTITQYLLKISKNISNGIIKTEEDKNLVFSWINQNIQKVSAKLLYSAIIDGDNASTFHNLCDDKGPTLIIVESTDGKIFGGYTKESWSGNSQYKSDKKAFIFSLDKKMRAELKQKSYSIYCSPSYGPSFGGGHDLYICSGCLNSKNSYSNPHSYKFKSCDNKNHFDLKSDNPNEPITKFQCKNVEVYAISEN